MKTYSFKTVTFPNFLTTLFTETLVAKVSLPLVVPVSYSGYNLPYIFLDPLMKRDVKIIFVFADIDTIVISLMQCFEYPFHRNLTPEWRQMNIAPPERNPIAHIHGLVQHEILYSHFFK